MKLFESRITVLQEPGMSDEEWDDQEEGFPEIGSAANLYRRQNLLKAQG